MLTKPHRRSDLSKLGLASSHTSASEQTDDGLLSCWTVRVGSLPDFSHLLALLHSSLESVLSRWVQLGPQMSECRHPAFMTDGRG